MQIFRGDEGRPFLMSITEDSALRATEETGIDLAALADEPGAMVALRDDGLRFFDLLECLSEEVSGLSSPIRRGDLFSVFQTDEALCSARGAFAQELRDYLARQTAPRPRPAPAAATDLRAVLLAHVDVEAAAAPSPPTPVFLDGFGQLWGIHLNAETARDARDATGFDPDALGVNPIAAVIKLMADDEMFDAVLYAISRDEFGVRHGLDAEGFGLAMNSDAAYATARHALLNALAAHSLPFRLALVSDPPPPPPPPAPPAPLSARGAAPRPTIRAVPVRLDVW